MASRQHYSASSANSHPAGKSKNAIAVQKCRDRQKEVVKERQKDIDDFKAKNQRLETNIEAMKAEFSFMKEIIEAHNVEELKEFFK